MQRQERSFGTHNGPFHADEVTACALLLFCDLIDLDKVVRTRDPSLLDKCYYVCDVGGVYDSKQLRFDHHQREYEGTKSSAGMILDYLAEQHLICPDFAKHLDREWVVGVDAHDNGKVMHQRGALTFSHIIALRVPSRSSSPTGSEMDAAFFEAVQFTMALIFRMQEQFLEQRQAKKTVQEAMDAAWESDPSLLMFDKNTTWLESFFALGGQNHPAQFILMPSEEHWKLRSVPPSLERRMEMRRSHPKKWLGLQEKDLFDACGIDGAVFCHKGGFVSVWKTKEAALKAYQIAIKGKNL